VLNSSSKDLDVRYQNVHQNRITETALDKLIFIQSAVVVHIESSENGLDPFLRVVLALAVRLTLQVIDRVDDLQHLLLVDFAVVVAVVQVEAETQLLSGIAVGGCGDGHEELDEIDFAGVVGVENIEDLGAEGLSLSLRIKLFENLRELLFVQFALWTILQEAGVPLVNFFARISGICQQKLELILSEILSGKTL